MSDGEQVEWGSGKFDEEVGESVLTIAKNNDLNERGIREDVGAWPRLIPAGPPNIEAKALGCHVLCRDWVRLGILPLAERRVEARVLAGSVVCPEIESMCLSFMELEQVGFVWSFPTTATRGPATG